jgi:hypothetical protein
MQRMLRVIALAAMTIGIASSAFAQAANTGTIEVFVTDPQGQTLPGATVEASAANTTTKRVAVSDETGKAVLELLEPSEIYTVKISMQGFKEQVRENQLVRVAQVLTIRTALALPGVEEAVTVSAETTPLVDVRSATTGSDITLRLTESLPTGRSYQSYLQLVPGVLPDDPSAAGNPASRSGLNYNDIGGALGVSTDNLYYLDGINVTDPVTGTFGANMNTEVIAEQKVTTGGIQAQFPGSPGLISQVVTKSGSNSLSGSGNYFFQNGSLVAENKHGAAEEFNTKDSAFTIGGPAWMNKAWFFGSYRYFKRADDVSAIDTLQLMRSVENTQKQGFAKGTFAPTGNDTASFSYLGDPTTISGSRLRDRPNSNDRSQEQGGHRYAGTYTRILGNLLIEGNAFKHNGEVSQVSSIRDGNNGIVYRSGQTRTIADDFLGGFGIDTINERDLFGGRANVQYNWQNHTFKGGFEYQKNENFRNTEYLDATYTSLAPINSGLTLADVAGQTGMTFTRRDFIVSNSSDFGGLIRTIDARPDRARFYDAFDADRNGVITSAELGPRAVLNSSTGNPDAGFINYDRTRQAAVGPQLTSSKGTSFYVSDTWRLNRFTFDLGLRTEQWKHFATTGEKIYTFEWAFAPRLAAVYDVRGDGRQKLSGYWGRYYDPIRNNMTNFAGTLTGSILEEQIFLLGDWVTYRTRGGPVVQDAFFSPTTKTPYTDETQIGYEIDLGRDMVASATYYNRRTRDILEDYDLALFAYATDGHTDYPGPINDPNSLWLGLDYFGYTTNPGSNFVIGTLFGGKRDANGLELAIRKRFSKNWQWQASYNYLDADGNTNSDSSADFQGDVLYLDPRAPNQFGRQPGTIAHLFKTAGSYTFNFGLQLGAVMQFNSGTVSSRTVSDSGRNLPAQVPQAENFEFAGINPADTQPWLAPDSVGSLTNEAWGQLDLRAQYVYKFQRVSTEFFVDLFNVTDSQSTIRNQDLIAGSGGIAFGEGLLFVPPRRAFFGVRARF